MNKISKTVGIMSKIRYYVNKNTSMMLYYALVYPYLIYGNVVWGNTYKTKLIPILNIQKKILRLLTFSPYREHSKPLFDKYKILNIYQINDFLRWLHRVFH